jgi:hypothetical protein
MGKSENSFREKVVVKDKEGNSIYMVFYVDLFKDVKSPEDKMHETGQKKPKCCEECGSESIVDLEVIGAETNPMFWLCMDCDALYLQYKLEETMEKLESASHIWTNPNDWGWRDKDEFN